MAIVKFGASVVGIRGTIGGITFSANKSGPTARVWSRGSVPQTASQQANKALIASLPPNWAALSSAQKAAWDTWAADAAQARTNSLGESYNLSGFQQFMAINSVLQTTTGTQRTAPPAATKPAAPTLDSVTFHTTDSAGNSTITFTPPEFTNRQLVFACAIAIGTGRQVHTSKFANVIAGSNFTSGTISFQGLLQNVFGVIGLNRRLFWQARKGNQGYLSAPSTGFVDVQET